MNPWYCHFPNSLCLLATWLLAAYIHFLLMPQQLLQTQQLKRTLAYYVTDLWVISQVGSQPLLESLSARLDCCLKLWERINFQTVRLLAEFSSMLWWDQVLIFLLAIGQVSHSSSKVTHIPCHMIPFIFKASNIELSTSPTLNFVTTLLYSPYLLLLPHLCFILLLLRVHVITVAYPADPG